MTDDLFLTLSLVRVPEILILVAVGALLGELYASVVALAVIGTLLLQALPAPWLAGRLGLLDAPLSAADEPAAKRPEAPRSPRRVARWPRSRVTFPAYG